MIPLIKSTFYKEKQTKAELIRFIKSASQLSFSNECEKFEENFAKWQGRKHAVFVNSGSSANLAIFQALLNVGKLKKGDSVGFSSITWSTNVMPLIQLGLKPVPVDVELDTLNVSSRMLQKVFKKHRLKAFFLTNLLGFCHDIDAIQKFCEDNNIILIEDNCESQGSLYKGQKLGNFGIASTFSFYVGHQMSSIEGGAICTDDDTLATMLRIVRAHGWDRNLKASKQSEMRNLHKVNSTFYSRYTFYDVGYNMRPTEINGFIGNLQLRYVNEILNKRYENFKIFSDALYSQTDRYYPIRSNHIDFVANFAIPIVCKSRKIKSELIKKCSGKIEIRPIVGGDISSQPFFKKYVKGFSGEESNARYIHDHGLYFGNNPELTKKEIRFIIDVFTQ